MCDEKVERERETMITVVIMTTAPEEGVGGTIMYVLFSVLLCEFCVFCAFLCDVRVLCAFV